MADTLEDLAARCESATGPDRNLDADICVAALGFIETVSAEPNWRSFETPDDQRANVKRDGESATDNVPRLTASIDAAMMLVPEGWGAVIGSYHTPERKPFARLFPPDYANSPFEMQEADGCNGLALALCAAALRAIAKERG